MPTGGGTGSLAWAIGFSAGALSIRTSTPYDPYQDFAVRITYTSKFSQKPDTDRIKTEYFIVRLTPSETCIWDSISKTAEIPNWIYLVGQATVGVSRSPSFTRAISTCPLTQKLYFYDDLTRSWQDFGVPAVAAAHPFVTFADGLNSANTDIGKLTITAAKTGAGTVASTYWKPFKIYKTKITLDEADGNGS